MKINISYILLTAALFISFVLPSCETQDAAVDNGAEKSAPVAENRYGADGKPLKEDAEGDEKKSRFGFNPDETKKEAEGELGKKKHEVREIAKSERDAASEEVVKKKEKVKKPSGPPKPADAKYANKVAGDPLSVTLPGKNASLGKISVEKYDSSGNRTGQPLPKGTLVAVPDQSNPGQKIYFKVP